MLPASTHGTDAANRRHTTASAASARGIPAYAASLAASLANSAASALGAAAGGGDGVAGPLSVAAASLRFVAVAVVTAATTPSETAENSETAEAAAPLGSRLPPAVQSAATEGGGDGPRSHAPRPRGNQRHQQQPEERRKSLGRLLEVLWSSGCLEACVQVVGEAPPREAATGGG